jgi:ComF family protein
MVMHKIISPIKETADDLLSLVWPNLCSVCNERLYRHERHICTKCQTSLPRTNFHLWKENDFHRLFWGRVKIKYASAYFYYLKESPYRKLIRKLKYENEPQIGTLLGREYGYEINESVFKDVDLILPVPLHQRRERFRGYNQSWKICEGLSESLNKPTFERLFIRKKDTETQTKKSRYERWENVSNIFCVTDLEKIKDKHILLVDDVVTTGSTMEACVEALLEAGAKEVSLAALGIAKN